MLANYSNDPTLFLRCINLIDSIFPGTKNMAISGMKYNACWDKISSPFIVEKNGEVIAHLGVTPLEIMLNGKIRHVAAIHGVCVKESFRGKGLFKQLMQEALKYIENNFDASLLFTDNPNLYEPFNFTVLPEYDFIITACDITKTVSDLRVLSLDSSDDLKIIQTLLHDHVVISNQMSLINETALFILNNLNNKLCFSSTLNTLIIYEITNNDLYIKDILAKKQYQLSDIIKLIPENYDKIVLQFCPDKYVDLSYTPIVADTDGIIMISEDFNFKGKYFRYPTPYRC
jgi:predicted GNAT family acetyltransferase